MRKIFRRNTLIAVLAFAYVLMTLLVIQQAHTIDSQRTLIRQLFHDSLELNAVKTQQVHSSAHR